MFGGRSIATFCAVACRVRFYSFMALQAAGATSRPQFLARDLILRAGTRSS